ncbi:MAG: hypothetical protein ACRDE7_10715 [Sphingobacterium sp.]
MENLFTPRLLLGVALMFSATAYGQDSNTDNHTVAVTIPEVALVDIEPAADKNITLGFTPPTEAGEPVTAEEENSTLWLNYSSIKSTTDATRNVSVRLSTLIPGVDLQVTAATVSGIGEGTFGTPSAQLTLSETDQTIISGIGSAYTGNGSTNGHNLTYAISSGTVGDYADLEASTSPVTTVTYTISDN